MTHGSEPEPAEPVPGAKPAPWVRGFLAVLGLVVIGLWLWVAGWQVRVSPRPILDASLFMGLLLLVGSYGLTRNTVGYWLLGLGSAAVAILISFYLFLSVIFDPGVVGRLVFVALSSVLLVVSVVALVQTLQADAAYGASGLRKAAIAGAGTLTAALGLAITGYSAWFSAVIGPADQPPKFQLDATVEPVFESDVARVFAVTVTAKNTGGTRVMFLGDVYNAATATTVADSSASYRCSIFAAIGNPTESVDGCPPAAYTTLPPLGTDRDRAIRGLAETWSVFQSGSLSGPGSWIEPGDSETFRSTLVAPKDATLVRDTIRVTFARGDRLLAVQWPAGVASCKPDAAVHLFFQRLGNDVVPSLLAATVPVLFEVVWTIGDEGADLLLCYQAGDEFVPYVEGDTRIDSVVRELGILNFDKVVDGYWQQPDAPGESASPLASP